MVPKVHETDKIGTSKYKYIYISISMEIHVSGRFHELHARGNKRHICVPFDGCFERQECESCWSTFASLKILAGIVETYAQ